MGTDSIEAIKQDLHSADPEFQALAVQRAAGLIQALAEAAVDALRQGSDPFVVAEHLASLGSPVIKPLVELCAQSDDPEVRTLGAVVLLQLGSQAGVPWLIKAVRNPRYADLAANQLARYGIRGAAPEILARLQECAVTELDHVVSLLLAYQKLAGGQPLELLLPWDLYIRFTAADAPWQIRSLFGSSPVAKELEQMTVSS